jgi:hypothetical protein
MNERSLITLQEDLAGCVASDAYFSTITILTDRKDGLLERIQNSLAVVTEKGGKVGACVLVMQFIGKDKLPGASAVALGIQVVFRVLEDPVLNMGPQGTCKEAESICKRLLVTMKAYQAAGLCKPLTPEDPCIVPVQDDLAPVAFEVRFTTLEDCPNNEPRAAAPVITPSTGAVPKTITLTCATSAAEIWYTTDGSHPYSDNAAASKYTDPIVIIQACTLRTRAFKSGYIGSNTNAAAYS